MAQSDLFLLPTAHGEGMPNCVLEAMAAGLPVVTCPVGGIKDFFLDGRHGCLIGGNHSAQIAKAIRQLLNDNGLRDEIAKYNAAFAKKYFSAEKVADYLNRLYENLFAGSIHAMPIKWYVSSPTDTNGK